MQSQQPTRMGDAKALARIVETFPTAEHDAIQEKRQMIAEFCRVLGARFSVPKTAVAEPEPHPASHAANQDITGLTRRHQQTLGRLLVGDSEKQIASRLEVSPHTVHVYVKALYRRFEVSSRGELLARFVRTPNSLQVAPASPE